MIDPRILRDEPDRVRASQAKRGLSDEVVDRAISADETRRHAIAEFERLRGEQKQLGKLIPKASGEEKAGLLTQTKELAGRVKAAEAAQTEAEDRWRSTLMEIPNVAADEAPAGGEDDYVVLETIGTPPSSTSSRATTSSSAGCSARSTSSAGPRSRAAVSTSSPASAPSSSWHW